MIDILACRVPVVPVSRRSAVLLTTASVSHFLLSATVATAAPAGFATLDGSARLSVDDLVLPDLDGAPRALRDLAGRPVLLHVFATWCEPCQDELPRLVDAARQVDAALYAVSLAEPAGRVRRFLDRLGLTLSVQLDTDRAAARRLGLSLLPSTWILDRGLAPRFVAEGDRDWSVPELASLLRTLDPTPDVR